MKGRVLLTAAGVATAVSVALGGVANAAVSAAPLHGGQHGCTDTNPELTVSDVNATVYYSPGSDRFTAVHSPYDQWNDTYLVSGYNRGSDSDILCGHYGSDYGYQLPFSAGANVSIVSSLGYSAYNGFAGTIGWDLWLVRTGEEYTETTAREMEADHRSVEIMVTPGHYGVITTVNGVWHRVYIGGGTMRGVNLSALIDIALRRIGESPSSYQVEAIPAGAEFTRGTFSVTGYALSVTTSETEKRSASYTFTYAVRSGKYSAAAAKRVTASVSRTITLPVAGASLSVQQAKAAGEAANWAAAVAYASAKAQAVSSAHSAAVAALYEKMHPYRVLPRIEGGRLGWAIDKLHAYGFADVTWPRGFRSSAYVVWQAGHPGHLTSTKAHITLRVRK